MRIILALVVLVGSSSMLAQGFTYSGVRSQGMSHATLTVSDAWAYHHNPGATGFVKELEIGYAYQNSFLLAQFQSQSLAIAVPTKFGVWTVGGQFFGRQNFQTQRIGLGYALPLGENLSLGVQGNYMGLSINENYGNTSSVTAEAGLLAKITDQWLLGFSILNLGRAPITPTKSDRFSTIMRLGTSYRFSDKIMVSVEGRKDVLSPAELALGLEYMPIDKFYLRCGGKTGANQLSFGFGYQWKMVQLDVATNYTQFLGFTPGIGIAYKGKRLEK